MLLEAHIYPSACEVSWMDLVDAFVAGTKAYLLVLPKDAFGNIISSAEEPRKDYFMVSATYENGSAAVVNDFKYNGWNDLGYIGIGFVPITSGSLLLHVYGENQTLSGSPLPFLVTPGPLNISNSLAKWKYGINSLQIFSKLQISIYQKDHFGNLVPGFYTFDARVVQKATSLSVPVADLLFEEVARGVQLLSFIVTEPGDFMLTIFNGKLNESISSMPYHYNVFIGYCHGLNSFANGSGLAVSVAGKLSNFTVYLKDRYDNPSPVEAERIQVQFFSENGDLNVHPIIVPLTSLNAVVSKGPTASFPALPANENSTVTGEPTALASDFKVSYTPEKSGEYEIWVFCGNVPLNNGHSYLMRVSPGVVDTSLSTVINFVPKVKSIMRNAVSVQLMDVFSNAVPSQQQKLSLQIEGANSSSFLRWPFISNEDGLYVAYYQLRDLRIYNICISFEDQNLSPCPFEVQVYERNYFPEACNDSISVWEGESVAFDVLMNDYVPGGQATITESSFPLHGSLLQYGRLFRYTPFKDFFGNDSFSYTFTDINQNFATGTALIYVLCDPPQFISLPSKLAVTEDVVFPKFGGFSGIEIFYSDQMENVSLIITAQSGTVFLAPMPFQLCLSKGNLFSVSRGGRSQEDLIIAGRVEIINSALQSIQYLGNENFYGKDIISLYAMNVNGVQDAQVPVFVEPINDPPIIRVPKFITLGRKETDDGLQIFDKQRDVFDFSISDADIFSFPGNKYHVMVVCSMEVNEGILSTSLPVHLIQTAELKTKGSNQWQPLQTFVTISNHFVMKGRGVRLRGTIGDCNNAMQQLFYQGAHQDDILTITVNDLGNYGCYPDCTDMASLPLFTEVTVNLIRMKPVGSVTALLLGSAVILEIVMMLLLGGLLLLFLCKCMNALQRKRRKHNNNSNRPREECLDNQAMNVGSSREVTHLYGSSSSFSPRRQHSSFRQRSLRGFQPTKSSMDRLPLSSEFAGDGLEMIPLSTEDRCGQGG